MKVDPGMKIKKDLAVKLFRHTLEQATPDSALLALCLNSEHWPALLQSCSDKDLQRLREFANQGAPSCDYQKCLRLRGKLEMARRALELTSVKVREAEIPSHEDQEMLSSDSNGSESESEEEIQKLPIR